MRAAITTAWRLTLLSVLASPGWASQDESVGREIDGEWTVVSVEFAGTAVPGFGGAELSLRDGKKTFRLPDGAVEMGTYTLGAKKSPKEIDATTEGRDEVARGIYSLEGETLKMCLSQSGRTRPARFRTETGSDLLLMVLTRKGKPGKPRTGKRESGEATPLELAKEAPRARSFRMGFTGFVYDTTLPAVAGSRRFVRENGDILAHHIEGVPWAEALHDQPFPPKMLEEWRGKVTATPRGGKVYLAISPGRGDLKLADKAGPLPPELRGKSYDHRLVKKAYLSYCRRSVEFFKPDYLAIGIEVNEIHSGNPARWAAYVELHRYVYRELKKENADLPVFASCTLHNLHKHRGAMVEEFKKLMPYNDLVAVSYYPFFVPDPERLSALDWMLGHFDEFKKPYAMVETNDAAEVLRLPMSGHVIAGSLSKQRAYYEKLLSIAQARRFIFVISFVHQDYDALWERIKDGAPELFMAWRDCGLLDENGKPRPAYEVWKRYFTAPYESGGGKSR